MDNGPERASADLGADQPRAGARGPRACRAGADAASDVVERPKPAATPAPAVVVEPAPAAPPEPPVAIESAAPAPRHRWRWMLVLAVLIFIAGAIFGTLLGRRDSANSDSARGGARGQV